MLDTNQAPSSQALEDLKLLTRDYGVNEELIQSLKTGKEESRAHIRSFKRMMFASNGALMAIGAAGVIFGGIGFLDGFSVIRVLSVFLGLLLFAKFFTVFLSMNLAIRKTEDVARKHDLI
jgi:hypothetical protein